MAFPLSSFHSVDGIDNDSLAMSRTHVHNKYTYSQDSLPTAKGDSVVVEAVVEL